MAVGGFFLDAAVLFGIARWAYGQMAGGDRSTDNSRQALVAIVFSAMSVEAFLNELAEIAESSGGPHVVPDAPQIQSLGAVLREAEESRASVELKYLLARIVLKGDSWDRGSSLYQDFATLLKLRNALVHLKPLDRFSVDPGGFVPANILKRLRPDLLADDPAAAQSAWTLRIGTRAMARWACNTAAATVHSIADLLPGDEMTGSSSGPIHESGMFKTAVLLVAGQFAIVS